MRVTSQAKECCSLLPFPPGLIFISQLNYSITLVDTFKWSDCTYRGVGTCLSPSGGVPRRKICENCHQWYSVKIHLIKTCHLKSYIKSVYPEISICINSLCFWFAIQTSLGRLSVTVYETSRSLLKFMPFVHISDQGGGWGILLVQEGIYILLFVLSLGE